MSKNINHKERAHSKYSASGAERWIRCGASVALEEAAPPSKENRWSKEGTLAHECLEKTLRGLIPTALNANNLESKKYNIEMRQHAVWAANRIWSLKDSVKGFLHIEKKVFASHIHPEMFGTCDAIIVGDGVLYIIDYKYGENKAVSAQENHQLIQYALSVYEAYRPGSINEIYLMILQPRASEKGHNQWELPVEELTETYLPIWKRAVRRVESGKEQPNPGAWCHWCRAKNYNCPAKQEKRTEKFNKRFGVLEN